MAIGARRQALRGILGRLHLHQVFYGWWVLLATSAINFWGAGVYFYSLTAFLNPMVQEFKWSYAQFSLAMSFRSMESGIATPIVGYLTDKVGPRRLLLVGGIIVGAGSLLLSRTGSLWAFYGAFLFLSIGSSFLFPLPGWTTVANWFLKKRGMAIGLLSAAIGLGGVLIPFMNWLISQYGWRGALVVAGLVTWAIAIPLSLLVRHHPEQYGYLPDGERPAGGQGTPVHARSRTVSVSRTGLSVRAALKTRPFWIIALAGAISSSALNAVAMHVMPSLISVEVPRVTAGYIAGAIVMVSAAGRLGFGWLGDRVDKRRLMVVALVLEAMGLLVFAYTRSVPQALLFLVLFGLGYGGMNSLGLSLLADCFGRRAFGSILGLTQGLHMVGNMLAPVFAGLAFDIWGGYQLAWLAMSALVALAIPLPLLVERPQEQGES